MPFRLGFLLVLFLALVRAPHFEVVAQQQAPDVVGPLLVSTTVGATFTTLYDVGSEQSWEWQTASSTLAKDWSPDGCLILIEEFGTGSWSVLSIADMAFHPIPITTLRPFWTPTGDALTYSQYDRDADSTSVYNLEISASSPELLFTADGSIYVDKWLSETELLYDDQAYWFIWDAVSQESRPYPSQDNQLYAYNRLLAVEIISPGRTYIAEYFDLRDYEYMTAPDADISEARAEWLQTIVPEPGFDIVDIRDGTTVHVSMESYLQTLTWSPSSSQILVSTDPLTTEEDVNGLYIYNLESQALDRVSDFPAVYNGEYGPYPPTWSADETWIALHTYDAHILYNLIDGQIIDLDDVYNSFYRSLSWSPIMDYAEATCAPIG